VINHTIVKVLSTKMSITSGRQDFKDAIINRKERDIKRSSSEIVDDDLGFTALLVETVGNSGGGGFVENTENVETSDYSCVFNDLTLASRPKTSC
jgi:hypothetical protein